jgi:DNA polymerase-1
MKPKLVIIDAMAMIHRAYHAFSRGGEQLRTPEGEPTSATYGFAKLLLQIMKDVQPEYMVVATDAAAKTFRHEEFVEYKANRTAPHDDLIAQIPRVYELIERFNIPFYSYPGYEADDIIGSLAKKLSKDYMVYIVSGDQDLFQLLDENVKIFTPTKDSKNPPFIDVGWLKTERGIDPKQVPDYKALVGDNSDNIPGVAGIGPKTAVELIQKYADLDGIYAHLAEIKDSVRTKLETHKDIAYLSRKLATISCDLDLDFDPIKAGTTSFDRNQVAELFEALSFRTLANQIPDGQQTLL